MFLKQLLRPFVSKSLIDSGYQKELAKKKKQEEKLQRKLDKKNLQAKESPEQALNKDEAHQ